MLLSDFPYNQYRTTAEVYDLDDRPKLIDDIKFYVDHCVEAKGNILELCCGTGRITIPVAESGCNITGLDISRPMLDVFRNKLRTTPAEVKARIELVEGDMANFNLGKKYQSIIIPFSSFQGLWMEEDINNCLKCVFEHLEDNGTFVLHCFKPLNKLDESWLHEEERDNVVLYNDDRSINFKRTSINKAIDVRSQIIYSDLFYYTYKNGALVDKKIEHLKLKYYYEDQLCELLTDHGFAIQHKFGYFDKRSIHNPRATEMIIISGK